MLNNVVKQIHVYHAEEALVASMGSDFFSLHFFLSSTAPIKIVLWKYQKAHTRFNWCLTQGNGTIVLCPSSIQAFSYSHLSIYIYGLCLFVQELSVCLFVQELLPQFSPKSSQIFCEHSTSPGIETVGFH